MLDPRIEEVISTQIAGQFPDFYREEGPLFVAFVEAYYRWLETEGQALYHSRRVLKDKDVDTTADEFLVHFKQKYLRGIQLETESNVRQLIKHSLDLYRTKGTERSIDLLFRLVFGVGAEVYFPSKDVFRLSSGKWVRPIYLEFVDKGDANAFLGTQIEGVLSGARGFVERIVRKKTPSRYVDVMYISDAKGVFEAGEVINRSTSPLAEAVCPIVAGSLSSLVVLDGGGGYSVGDIVDLSAISGYGGQARVTSVTEADGAVVLELVDGGFGYTNTAQILVSDAVITLAGMAGGNGEYFDLFDSVVQTLATVDYEDANGTFSAGQQVFNYHANSDLKGTAYVSNVATINSTHGNLVLSVVSGTMDGDRFYTTGNAVSANQGTVSETTVTGNVIATGDSTITVTSRNGTFVFGETITQGNSYAVVTGSSGDILYLEELVGRFTVGANIFGSTSGAYGAVQDVAIDVGVTVDSGSFVPGRFTYAVKDSEVLRLTTISEGTGFQMEVGSLDQVETVDINTDFLIDIANVELDAVAYGFTADPSANLSSVMIDAMSFDSYDVGRISTINLLAPGQDYALPPMIRVFEPAIFGLNRTGYVVTFIPVSGTFSIGEIIEQEDTGARGQVLTSNSSTITMKRMSIGSSFSLTTNSSTQIVGVFSGAVANAIGVDTIATDHLGYGRSGADAILYTEATTAEGVVTTLDVIDSGFGYSDGREVGFSAENRTPGSALASALTQGRGTGYWKTKGGLLSSTKYLFDGDYWQEFSYEVRSSKTLDSYGDMLKQVVHVAGTKMFGALVTDSRLSAPVDVSSSMVVS